MGWARPPPPATELPPRGALLKLGVDGRFFSDSQTLGRGMGRYVLNQLAALGEHRPDVETVILLRADGVNAHERLGGGKRCVVLPAELERPTPLPTSRSARLRRDADLSDWYAGLGLDVLLAPTPFVLGPEPFPPLPGPLPTVVNLFDLIPFVFRDQYLVRGSPFESQYLGVLERLPFADAYIAISEFVLREAVAYLGITARRIHVGYPIPAPVFRPAPPDAARSVVWRLGIPRARPGSFVMTVPHTHHTKNLRTLLEAWAGLPADFRARRTLVLTCDLASPESRLLDSWIREAGIEGEVAHTGYVSDEDLAALYSAAWIYVHPSRYEGFGLPVVEAQACGTAVVSSCAASLPEATGEGGLLVDPEDPGSFREALLRLDGQPEVLEELRRRAPISAARFTSRRLANAIVGAAEAALAARRPARTSHRRPRLALVSPVPPQASGVADYAAELAGALARQADVELFVDTDVSPASALSRWPTHDVRRLPERDSSPGFDAVLHQMGASSFHLFTERAIQEVPGIVTLHDLVWGRVLYHLGRDAEGRARLERQIRRIEGPAALSEFRQVVAAGGEDLDTRVDGFFGRHPVIGDIVHSSRGIVVHFPEAARRLRERFPGAVVRWFPMGVADPLRPALPLAAVVKARYGLPYTDLLVGVFGIADPVKRLDVTIRALGKLVRRGHRVRLVIAGRFTTESYRADMRALAARVGAADRVHFVGAPPMEDFEALMGACDIVVNLRFPSHLQMSATLVRALAAGKPVVTTDLPEWRFLPDDACVRVPADAEEVGRVAETLERWATNPGERSRRGSAARSWYLDNATLEAMASSYVSFVREVIDSGAEGEIRT